MTALDFDNYKNFLTKVINEAPRGIVNQLSVAAGCQRSYLSQTLNSHVNLTHDHLFGIAEFLQLSEIETEYLLALLERDKASSHKYRSRVEKKISDLLKKSKRLSEQVSRVNSEVNEKYYSAWYYSAIHVATSIDSLKTEKDYAKYCNLDRNLVATVLRELENWGLVEMNNNRWSYAGEKNTHIKDIALLNRLNHTNWRTQAISRPLNPSQDVHYTSVFTIAEEDFEKLRLDLLKYIREQRKDISNSESESLVCFCADLFKVANSKQD